MTILQKLMAVFLSSWLLFAPGVIYAAQSDQSAGQSATQVVKHTPEELQQMVAPIALYPDDLLSLVLMGSSYPLEVVQADRWLSQNKGLTGDQLKAAVDNQGWDASVKSLVATPDVLTMMSSKLDWTQKLGDAVLAQQPDVMDAIQRLRARAQGNDKLKTTPQQVVAVTQQSNGHKVIRSPDTLGTRCGTAANAAPCSI